MSLIKKSSFSETKFEYKSEDDEIYNISFINNDDRYYISWEVQTNEKIPKVVIDEKMLELLYSVYSQHKGSLVTKSFLSTNAPNIIDNREKNIKKVLDKPDPDVLPFVSFNNTQVADEELFSSLDSSAIYRTGIDVSKMPEINETPEEIKKIAETIRDTSNINKQYNVDESKKIKKVSAEKIL